MTIRAGGPEGGRLINSRQSLPGMSSADISDHNARVVIAALRENGAMTRRALARVLGLTETAIAGIVRRLMTAGYLSETDPSDGGRGSAFSLISGAATGIGIHLGKERALLALADIGGTILEEGAETSSDGIEAWIRRAAGGAAGLTGVAITCCEDQFASAENLAARFPNLRVDWVRDTEAALRYERLACHTSTARGLAVILIDDDVRAGTMFSDRFFQGAHGRAGAIGAMRPAANVPTLRAVASAAAFNAHIAAGGDAEGWIALAASRLLDAIVAISGFVSPGAIRIGGALPEPVLDRLIDRIVADKSLKARHFIAADWIPEVTRLTDNMAAIARGAAMVPIAHALLPIETQPFA